MKHIFNHGLRRLTRMEEPQQGCAWQAKLALNFQIPSQSSLHGIVKTHHPTAPRLALLWRPCRRWWIADY
jgi:hypothetical protein